MAIVRKSLNDIKNYQPTAQDITQLQRLQTMTDDDIDFSDMPELTEEDFANAISAQEFWKNRQKSKESVGIDKTILARFQAKAKQTNSDYQTLINKALEEYLLVH